MGRFSQIPYKITRERIANYNNKESIEYINELKK